MKNVVVLNLLFKPEPYSDQDLGTISRWMEFFQDQGLLVIATPPLERAEVFDRLTLPHRDSFLPLPAMSFDTCDRWKAGLLKGMHLDGNRQRESRFYFLWSADFEFSPDAQDAAKALLRYEGKEDLVVGTIQATETKDAIDRLGADPLIRFWFPDEHRRMAAEGFFKPRSELLRFSEGFLTASLRRRWYPTEQTISLILQCFWDRRPICSLPFARLQDSAEARENPDIVQQIERMEVWLKYLWREHHRHWDAAEYLRQCEESSRIALEACRLLLSAPD